MSTQLSLDIDNRIDKLDQFRGAFVGAAIGDALGFITEFMQSPNDLHSQLGIDRLTQLMSWKRITNYRATKYKIKLPLPVGAYSDDTQLTLATARSIQGDGTFNVEAFSKLELPLWILYQLGGGSNTKMAARNMMKKNTTWYNNFYDASYVQYINSGGNGAAMRILPIALVNTENSKRRYLDVWRNAIISHGHPRGLIGAILMADAIASLMSKPPEKLAWLDEITERCYKVYPELINNWIELSEFSKWQQEWETKTKRSFTDALLEICQETANYLQLIRDHIKDPKPQNTLFRLGCYDNQTKGAGNSTVVAAIFFLCRLSRFEDAVISVANMIGIDTDTIGYFVGAMFGAYYGFEAIPSHFRENIQDVDYLLRLADWCHQVNSNNANSDSAFTYPTSQDIPIPQKVEDFIGGYPEVGAKLILPIFGPGNLVKDADITQHWTGKHVHWLQVSLDLGQTIFLQVDRQLTGEKQNNNPSSTKQKELTSEQAVVASLTVLDQFKSQIESNDFNPNTIMEVIQKIKFEKQDRAIYNAFTTWLWGALPKNVDEAETEIKASFR